MPLFLAAGPISWQMWKLMKSSVAIRRGAKVTPSNAV